MNNDIFKELGDNIGGQADHYEEFLYAEMVGMFNLILKLFMYVPASFI